MVIDNKSKSRGFQFDTRYPRYWLLFLLSLLWLVVTTLALSVLPGCSMAENPSNYGLRLCTQRAFHCVKIKPGNTWRRMFPDRQIRDMVMRLNRSNMALQRLHWIVVPRQLNDLDYMHLSPLPGHVDTGGHKLLLVNLSKFAFGAYDAKGDLVYWGPATGGRLWCNDLEQTCESAAGEFKIFRIQGADCSSSKFPLVTEGGAPMPWCMHYYKGYAIHGSTLTGFVNRSRGCVRLFNSDAKWLNQHFVKIGTTVIVKE